MKDRKLLDYLNFSAFTGEAEKSWIVRELWPISRKDVELYGTSVHFEIRKGLKELRAGELSQKKIQYIYYSILKSTPT